MITAIRMEQIASFKGATWLSTNKKINLVYGLNGTGKTTISDFLYDPTDSRFNLCEMLPEKPGRIFVYNQRFIKDNFFITDGLKGIFSLSKENKDAEERIAEAEQSIEELTRQRTAKEESREEILSDSEQQARLAIDEIWKIKRDFAGGDRVLEYCLEGLKGNKERMFSHLLSITRPSTEPSKTIADIKKEVELLRGDQAMPQAEMPEFMFGGHDVESAEIFTRSITGSEASEVARLIESLGNADWVRVGLEYLQNPTSGAATPCPFCQESTITSGLIEKIEGYFDTAYQEDIAALHRLQQEYDDAIGELFPLEIYSNHPRIGEMRAEVVARFDAVASILRGNQELIKKKLEHPSILQGLESSRPQIDSLNEKLDIVNAEIRSYNEKLQNRDAFLATLRVEFWQLMRWQYDRRFRSLCGQGVGADSGVSRGGVVSRPCATPSCTGRSLGSRPRGRWTAWSWTAPVARSGCT